MLLLGLECSKPPQVASTHQSGSSFLAPWGPPSWWEGRWARDCHTRCHSGRDHPCWGSACNQRAHRVLGQQSWACTEWHETALGSQHWGASTGASFLAALMMPDPSESSSAYTVPRQCRLPSCTILWHQPVWGVGQKQRNVSGLLPAAVTLLFCLWNSKALLAASRTFSVLDRHLQCGAFRPLKLCPASCAFLGLVLQSNGFGDTQAGKAAVTQAAPARMAAHEQRQ